jgi:hypothetical protein
MNPTSKNQRDILGELASEAVTLVCGKHAYTAARKRANGTVAIPPGTRGCADCWRVFYFTDLALTPPNKRQERLDELEEVIRHAVEFERSGKFGKDFELYNPGEDARFGVQVDKDAADDETGEDRIKLTDEEALN